MKKTTILYLIAIILLLSSCADTVNIGECVVTKPYGFWYGVWHGWIVLFSWIGSWFSDDIAIYAVNNNGGWYDFGFILGMGSFGGGSRSISKQF